MKKLTILLILVSLIGCATVAPEFQNTGSDFNAAVNNGFELHVQGNPDATIQYFQDLLNSDLVSEATIEEITFCYSVIGFNYYMGKDPVNAIEYMEQAINNFESGQVDNPKLEATVYLDTGKAYAMMQDYNSARSYFYQAYNTSTELEAEAASILQYEILDLTVKSHFIEANYQGALDTIAVIREQFDESKLPPQNLGISYKIEGESALNLMQYDNAINAYTKAIEYFNQADGDFNLDIARSYYGIGVSYSDSDRLVHGISSFLKSLEIYSSIEAVSLNDTLFKAIAAYNLGLHMENVTDYSASARYYFLAALCYTEILNNLEQNPGVPKNTIQEFKRRNNDAQESFMRVQSYIESPAE